MLLDREWNNILPKIPEKKGSPKSLTYILCDKEFL